MLQLDHVVFRADGRDLVRDVDLHARSHRLLAIVGPNGAGKTTLVRLGAGDLVPTSGSVLLDGEPLDGHRDLALRRSFLPYSSSFTFPFTVAEIVWMGRHPHRGGSASADDRAVAHAMSEADVEALAQRMSTTLSAGEQQRTALARVLAQETPLVLLDEPTAALDIAHQHRVMAVLRRRAADGAAVVAVLHDLNLAARYADDVALLADGCVVATGDPESVLTADRLSAVYGHPMAVTSHPALGHPLVVPS